ncbi:hypothetical protein [Rhizobium leguminosarum]
MSIKDVCDAVTARLSNIEEDTLQNAEDALASWIGLIDQIDQLPINNERLKKIVDDTTAELFKDINISLILSVSGNYGAACVLARGCIEKCIYILYFLDHPMTAFEWSINDTDISFSTISEQMSTQNYFELATGKPASKSILPTKLISDLRKIYRQYSESVHGKYNFTETRKGETVISKEYYGSIKESASILKHLIGARLVG